MDIEKAPHSLQKHKISYLRIMLARTPEKRAKNAD
jgi:hypothetical protein